MTQPHKSTIKRKVMTAIMLASFAALLVTVAAFMVYDLVTFRQTMVQNLDTQARIIAENSTAALAFKNENDAVNVLTSLRNEPHIIAAAIYDAQGKLFVKYPAQIAAADLPAAPQNRSYQFGKSHLTIFQPIVQSGAPLGTLFLRSDLTALSQRLQLYAAISLLIMLGSLLVAFWLSNTLQRRISNPVIALAETARKISEQRNYSFRAIKTSDDELGDLTEEFNSMLNQIQTSHSALSKSEEQLRIVADHASVYLCQFDRECRFKFANRAYAERYHLEPLQLIGKHLPEVLGTAAYELIRPYIDEAFTGKKVEFEMEVPYATLGLRWVHVVFVPERNLEGEIVGVVAVINDVTERKRAEQASRQLAAIVESSADAIISKDVNGIITSWNHGAEQLFGYKAQEVVGRPILILIPEDHQDEEPHILERVRRGERIEHYETIRQRKDGKLIEISLTVSPIRNGAGKVVGASKIARDISQQKQFERELERAHKEAVAASRAKDDFLAALSHELRTPLNPVLLVASDAAENPKLPPEIRADFDMIRRNVELEARLIDDMLDLTRITRGKLSLEKRPLDVRAVLQDAIAILQADVVKKKISLTFDFRAAQHMISGDAVRLQQIFWNVLKNAVKFTPEGGKITIETRTLAESGNIAVEITDTGIGLTADEISHIFEAFSQGDHAAATGAHRFGGLGLGLAISRMLVELHSGTIRAASVGRDQGATFTIEFQCLQAGEQKKNSAPAEQPAADSQTAPKKKSGKRILLVEDHEPTRTALAHLLTRRDYKVMTANSAAEALALARRESFDLVVSDIGLPDGDGYTLMRELRDDFGLQGIALTGYGTDQDVARGQTAGFIAHLTKPVHMESLEKALHEAD
jgi:PAS domain S-box-containing protein